MQKPGMAIQMPRTYAGLIALFASLGPVGCSSGGTEAQGSGSPSDSGAPSSDSNGGGADVFTGVGADAGAGDGRPVDASPHGDVGSDAPSAGDASSCPRGTAYPDGCPGAPQPAGTIQDPHILDPYGANRPPWNVAGVDYYVGAPAKPLKDWQTLISSAPLEGLDWDSRGYFRCNTGNVVIDGYDFTTGSMAWSIYAPVGGCTGLTITNSKMGCIPGAGTGPGAPAFGGLNLQNGATVFVFTNNTVDYADCMGPGGASNGLINNATVASFDLEYNYFHELFADIDIWAGAISSGIYKYNLVDSPATSAVGDPAGVHMNMLSWGAGTASGIVVSYNTTFASLSYAGGELIQIYWNGGGSYVSPVFSNNTFPGVPCMPKGQCVSYQVHGSAGGYIGAASTLMGTATNADNYFDANPAYSYGVYYPGSMAGWTSTGNIDMRTGATITPP